MNMDFGTNKIPVEVIKEGAFGGTESGTESGGKNSMIQRISIGGIIAQIIMMLVLNVEHH